MTGSTKGVARKKRMQGWPDTPFPPKRVHKVGNRLLCESVDGVLCWLDGDSLEVIGEPTSPFPGRITHSIAEGDGDQPRYIGMWIDRELRAARMAALNLQEQFTAGGKRDELRTSEHKDPGAMQVAGSLWSHSMDAEPLGLVSNGERVAFCMHRRGLYCIEFTSEEHWRVPLVNWPELAPVPDGSQIVCLVSAPGPDDSGGVERLWAWSAGGGWSVFNWESGELLSMGSLDLRERLESAWVSPDGEWLLASAPERMARWTPGEEPESAHVTGPVSDALWIDDGWSCAGWREDLRWDRRGLKRRERPEIGIALLNRKEGLILLDNMGGWSTFQF